MLLKIFEHHRLNGVAGYHASLTTQIDNGRGPEFEPQFDHQFLEVWIYLLSFSGILGSFSPGRDFFWGCPVDTHCRAHGRWRFSYSSISPKSTSQMRYLAAEIEFKIRHIHSYYSRRSQEGESYKCTRDVHVEDFASFAR